MARHHPLPGRGGGAFTRTNTFVMPVYTALPNGETVNGKLDGFTVNVEVLMDHENTMRYTIQVQRTLPAGVAPGSAAGDLGPTRLPPTAGSL